MTTWPHVNEINVMTILHGACYPLILLLVGFSVSHQSIEQVHLFVIKIQKSASLSLGVCSEFFVKYMFIPLWGKCKKCPSI